MNIVLLESLGINKEALLQLKKDLVDKSHDFKSYDFQPKDAEETVKRIQNADIVITVNYPLNAGIINSCKRLKMVSIAFTGFDHIDTELCKQKGIVVCNSAGYATDSVAELTFGLIISVLRKICESNQVVRNEGTRNNLIGNELNGKTLGIVGTGAIGSRVAEVGKVFGCKLLGFSRSKRKDVENIGVKYVNLPNLLKESDIVSVHIPLTDKTKDLISWSEFKLMKKTAILIQVSRGGTINEDALVEALNSGKIAGAGIDVFTKEPPLDPDIPLLKAKNTVLTPHIAFATQEALVKRANIAFTNVNKWLLGKPQNVIV